MADLFPYLFFIGLPALLIGVMALCCVPDEVWTAVASRIRHDKTTRELQ